MPTSDSDSPHLDLRRTLRLDPESFKAGLWRFVFALLLALYAMWGNSALAEWVPSLEAWLPPPGVYGLAAIYFAVWGLYRWAAALPPPRAIAIFD